MDNDYRIVVLGRNRQDKLITIMLSSQIIAFSQDLSASACFPNIIDVPVSLVSINRDIIFSRVRIDEDNGGGFACGILCCRRIVKIVKCPCN